jgi:hypothetical protein
VGDWEDADTALRAAGVADEMRAAPAVGVCHGGVYDLNEVGHYFSVRPVCLAMCVHAVYLPRSKHSEDVSWVAGALELSEMIRRVERVVSRGRGERLMGWSGSDQVRMRGKI